jgi:hypothetical protein
MSRYTTLLETSTNPTTRVAKKPAVRASAVPPEGLRSADEDIIPTPIAPTPHYVAGAKHSAAPSGQQAVTSGNLSDPSAEGSENEASSSRTNQPPNERTIERQMERRFEQTNERTKVRHTFDILTGQLLCLREIVIAREKIFGKRVLLGDLVQEALDMFIAKERNNE